LEVLWTEGRDQEIISDQDILEAYVAFREYPEIMVPEWLNEQTKEKEV